MALGIVLALINDNSEEEKNNVDQTIRLSLAVSPTNAAPASSPVIYSVAVNSLEIPIGKKLFHKRRLRKVFFPSPPSSLADQIYSLIFHLISCW